MQTRAFIIDNDQPRRVPWAAFERLYSGSPREQDLMPEYAGQTMKMVQATLSDDGVSVTYPLIRFDSDGALDQGFLSDARRYAVNTLDRPRHDGNVVHVGNMFRAKAQATEFRWHPHPELDTTIRTVIGVLP